MNNQEITPANKLRCPRCQLSHIKRNGHTYYGKQNYRCKLCDRQFVVRGETVSQEKRELIKSLLLERISLRGICRVLKVSLSWLIRFIKQQYQSTPEDLHFAAPDAPDIEIFCVEARLKSHSSNPRSPAAPGFAMERNVAYLVIRQHGHDAPE